MKVSFEIEYPDKCGPLWMNKDNLMLCINSYCENKDGNIKAVDITDEVSKLRRVVAALFDESDTRIPKGFDQKSDEYAMRVSVHNQALMELARALDEVGYRE